MTIEHYVPIFYLDDSLHAPILIKSTPDRGVLHKLNQPGYEAIAAPRNGIHQ
jgi:hypothetical protein